MATKTSPVKNSKPLDDEPLGPSKRTKATTINFFRSPAAPAPKVAAEPVAAAKAAVAEPVVVEPIVVPVETPRVEVVAPPAIAPIAEQLAQPTIADVPAPAIEASEVEPIVAVGDKVIVSAEASAASAGVGEGPTLEYAHFLEKRDKDQRTHAYISRELYENLVYIANTLGDNKFVSTTTLLNNIVEHHLQQFGPQIRKLIKEKEAQAKKKRRF
ncbi:DUF3408 domain-containing protein [Solirubrum puertoriconensis]|uniref:Conjugal transfer protein TraB n=1 Tax=Solirubrum puertoriconensis TaxID=1751427 RepID=A0A9X0HN72_SOLP1|nr:DUF3408 domain-containing protein [Solirubrum puertoriconensis]KUG09015.1 hypothetical protein ASU33_19520 [Solirubrum puertoriconensis]